MADDLNIVIEKDGLIKPMHGRLGRWLAKRAGLWKLIPSADNLLVFSRLGGSEQSDRTGELQFTGSVSAMGGLMDMITFLNNTKRSGALVMLADDVKKTLFFTDGDVRMATSNVPEDRLGAMMYRFGMVTRDQLREALKQQSGERRLGRVLIDMELITAHDLYKIIRRQVKEIFYSVLMLRSGVFYFYNVEEKQRLPVQMNLSTQSLLLDGVRRMDEMSYFRERIPNRHVIMEIRQDITPKDLSESQTKVYEQINGRTTVEEIARETRLGEFETTKVMFHLMQLGYVQKRKDTNITRLPLQEQATDEPGALSKVVGTFNSVLRKIYAETKAKGTEQALGKAVDSFFRGDTSFAALFQGITLASDGTLSEETLRANLTEVGVENGIEYLYNGLNELLFFEMFTAGEALTRAEEEELQQTLSAVFRELGK